MEIKNKILLEDLEFISEEPLLSYFKGSTIMVSGATGMIGKHIVKALLYSNEKHDLGLEIVVFARSLEKVKKVFEDFIGNSNLHIVIGEVNQPINYEGGIDYIFNCAGVTGDSKRHMEYPVNTIEASVMGNYNLLEFAKKKNVKGYLFLSTLEIYGSTDLNLESIKEKDYGYIDHLEPRNSHGESKRMAETICSAFAKQYNVPAKIARIPICFGPEFSWLDKRVWAGFIKSVINEENIVLNTKGDTIRNHCYLRDVVTACIYIILKGIKGEAYNVANMDTSISIKDMAEMVVSIYPENNCKVIINDVSTNEKFGYRPTIKNVLNSYKLSELGWKPSVGISEMFSRTIQSKLIELRMEDKNEEI